MQPTYDGGGPDVLVAPETSVPLSGVLGRPCYGFTGGALPESARRRPGITRTPPSPNPPRGSPNILGLLPVDGNGDSGLFAGVPGAGKK